jgi:hypothetical protein
LAACSDDPEATTQPPGPDGDGGGGDALADRGTGPDGTSPEASVDAGPAGRIVLANGITIVDQPVRICLLSSATSDEPGLADVLDTPALPSKGLGPGELASLATREALAGRSFRPVVFYAPSLEGFGLSDKSCKDIVADVRADGGATGNLIAGIDFELGDTFARGFFRPERSYLLLATGCPQVTPMDFAFACPEGFDGTRSFLRTIAYELDQTPAGPGKNRAQFVFGSEEVRKTLQEVDNLNPVILPGVQYADPSSDGGVRVERIRGLELDGGAQPFLFDSGVLQPLGTEVTDLKSMAGFWFNVDNPEPPRVRTVAEIDQLSNGFKVGDVQPGKAYTFLMIGTPYVDQNFADGGYNPAFAHISLIPND